MTLKEFKSMTEEEQLNLFKGLEEEKEFLDKALEKFINTSKNDEPKEKEKWISLSGHNGGAIKVSDIKYIESLSRGSLVVTNIIVNEKNLKFQCDDSPEEIVKKINSEQ